MVAQSRTGLPESSDSRTASSCRLRRISFASRINTSLRSAGWRQRQRPSSNASRALLTAKSTSSASQAATFASTAPVAGLTLSMYARRGLRKPPSTKDVEASVSPSAIALYSSWVAALTSFASLPGCHQFGDRPVHHPDHLLQASFLILVQSATARGRAGGQPADGAAILHCRIFRPVQACASAAASPT